MTDAEKYNHQKELNRMRQQKYYEANKEKILQSRKDERKSLKLPEDENTNASVLPKNQTFIERFESSLSQNKESSRNNYLNWVKKFMDITDCNNLEKCLTHPKKVLKLLEDSPYSINSKKNYIESVLVAITKTNIKLQPKTIAAYKNFFEVLKIKSIEENAKKQVEDKVEDFNKYLENIKSIHGENSKQYIISKMYDEATVRDDFCLKIIKSVRQNTNDKENYIVVPADGNLQLIINSYKTEDKNGVLNYVLSTQLTKLIRKYIIDKKIKYSDYLFGKAKLLSDYVSKMNKKIGITGSITYFRKMKIAQILRDENINDAQKRVELAAKMAHSPDIQLRYFREINV